MTGRVADGTRPGIAGQADGAAGGNPRRTGVFAIAGVAAVAVVAMAVARQAPVAPPAEIRAAAAADRQQAPEQEVAQTPAQPAGEAASKPASEPERPVALARAEPDAPAAEPETPQPAPVALTEEIGALPSGSARFGSPARTLPAAERVDTAFARLAPAQPGAREEVDASRTGSISPLASAMIAGEGSTGRVEIAETESDIAEIEEKLASEGAENFEVASTPAEAPPHRHDLTQSQTAGWVNMRAGPDNDAAVLTVVPANASIMAQDDCEHWCAVVYEGRQGYIYKSFIRRPGASAEG